MNTTGYIGLAAAVLILAAAEFMPLRWAVRLVDRGEVLVRRALRIRPKVGRIRRQTAPAYPALPQPDDDAPLVAPPVDVPEMTGRYAKLAGLGTGPVYAELRAEAEDDAARDARWDREFSALVDVSDFWQRWDAELAGWRATWGVRSVLTGGGISG